MDDIAGIASRWGIETDYVDAYGRRQTADPNAVRRIVAALAASGVDPAEFPPSPPPVPAFQGDGRRLWALAVQLYGVRSRRNWGHGDFTDLAQLIELAAAVGAAGIGLNPLHALFPDRAEQASPYAPNSRLFLNPLYIDVEAIPEFPGLDGAAARMRDALRAKDLVDYVGVAQLKLAALRASHERFRVAGDVERQRDFDAFRTEQGSALQRFAAFETLRGRFRRVWWEWPAEWRQLDAERLDALRECEAEEIGFHEFVQWIADRQLRHCRNLAHRHHLPVGLYVDLAVGVEAGGADAWIEQGAILKGLAVGAPPDALNVMGQDWGLTSFNPHSLVAQHFAPLRRMLGAAMRYAGAVRLDHVLGLMRLFVIPHGLSPKHGAYLRFPLGAMLSTVAEESRKTRCIVIGEDLGTVPEGFRDKMAAWGLWSYLVMLFERDHGGGFRPADRYAAQALATFNTHDLPSFAGWISGYDLTLKRQIGIDPGESDEERAHSRAMLRRALNLADDATPQFADVARFLAATPTRLVMVAIEDILAVEDQVNVPGTVAQHPNWQRRLPVMLENLKADPRLTRVAEVFAQARRSSGSRQTG
ncbi:MAG TPA: 4-alpha-glucanotransferase [Pseudolabrys sp.]|nr:4-alpha-glucanotransferase [Pseudolabrys sp.]